MTVCHILSNILSFKGEFEQIVHNLQSLIKNLIIFKQEVENLLDQCDLSVSRPHQQVVMNLLEPPEVLSILVFRVEISFSLRKLAHAIYRDF